MLPFSIPLPILFPVAIAIMRTRIGERIGQCHKGLRHGQFLRIGLEIGLQLEHTLLILGLDGTLAHPNNTPPLLELRRHPNTIAVAILLSHSDVAGEIGVLFHFFHDGLHHHADPTLSGRITSTPCVPLRASSRTGSRARTAAAGRPASARRDSSQIAMAAISF